MIKEIAFTAYPVTDMARARAFYEGVLGLTVETNHGDKWVEYDLGGMTFVIQNYTGETPSGSRGLVAFEVDDLDAVVARLKEAGTPFTMDVTESPICRFAMVTDPDGSAVWVHHRKTPAATTA